MSQPSAIRVKPNSVAILGYHDGNAGQIETWFEAVTGLHLACFVHEAAEPLVVDAVAENRKRVSQRMNYPALRTFKGHPLITSLDWIKQLKALGIQKLLPLVPDNKERLRQMELALAAGFELVSAIHPTVIVLSGATIAPGVWINAGSIIGYNAEIESGVLINTGVKIDHHNVLKRACQVDPGVVTAGNVTLHECAQVHTGATIINRIEIGAGAIIGAGAVVIENIPAHTTAVGVPARVIKHH